DAGAQAVDRVAPRSGLRRGLGHGQVDRVGSHAGFPPGFADGGDRREPADDGILAWGDEETRQVRLPPRVPPVGRREVRTQDMNVDLARLQCDVFRKVRFVNWSACFADHPFGAVGRGRFEANAGPVIVNVVPELFDRPVVIPRVADHHFRDYRGTGRD